MPLSLSGARGIAICASINTHIMIIHEIHDLSNLHVIEMLTREFKTITDEDVLKNYHPDYSDVPGNIFYILESGRYRKGFGKYYVMEQDGEYICSAGWNEYEIDPTIVLCLTRMYVNKRHRAMYHVGTHILPLILAETAHYGRAWITSNSHNKAIYNWFDRANAGKNAALFNNWPDIYKQFKPIGVKEVYYTEQSVVELKR